MAAEASRTTEGIDQGGFFALAGLANGLGRRGRERDRRQTAQAVEPLVQGRQLAMLSQDLEGILTQDLTGA
jgi:hypothetical protein